MRNFTKERIPFEDISTLVALARLTYKHLVDPKDLLSDLIDERSKRIAKIMLDITEETNADTELLNAVKALAGVSKT